MICPTDWRRRRAGASTAGTASGPHRRARGPTTRTTRRSPRAVADGRLFCGSRTRPPGPGFEKTLILRFLPDGRLSAEHILTNRNPQTVQAAAWGVCTLRGGGTARIPFPGGTAGEYTPGRVLSLWGQTSLADERLQFGPEEICARHLPRGTSLKLGVYTAKGKITAENLGQRLTVSCEVHPIAQCADHGCNVELYLNPDVMELETLGVLGKTRAGAEHPSHGILDRLSPSRRAEQRKQASRMTWVIRRRCF